MPTPVRVAVVAVVAALAVAIGVAASGFLTGQRAVGGGAAYVPADAPFFAELRLEASDAQDAALREFLGHFPAIEGIDLEQPLYGQLGTRIDEMLAEEGAGVTWADDVATWFDGRVAMALTDVPLDALDAPLDPSAAAPVPPFVVLLGVTDRAAAAASIDRILAEAGDGGPAFTESEHLGITIRSADDAERGAYALTDDQLIIAPNADGIRAALDAEADGAGTLAETAAMARLTEQLPDDWLAFMTYDMTELMTASLDAAGAESTEMASLFGSVLEHQSVRGAMALTAAGDRLALTMAADPPTGPFTVANAERRLAEHVPADALYYAEAGNIGRSFAAVISSMKGALAEAGEGEGEEQVRTIEAALGADLEELVAWIEDGAVSIGFADGEVYGGFVLVPNDLDAARRRLDQLTSFAGLGGLDPDSGISVEETDVAGVTVTTIRWDGGEDVEAFAMPAPSSVGVQYAITNDDLVVIGVGDRFVRNSLELSIDASLASAPRFSDAVAELGGPGSAGITWIDIAGVREAVEGAVGPLLGSESGAYEADVRPWLLPLDRIVSVARLEGDAVVTRSVLLVE